MNLRSDLGRARGLGSAKDGVRHWRLQRLTAVALVPLSVWFLLEVLCMFRADHATIVAWISAPYVTVLLIGFALALFWHMKLGLQVVIEDYVHVAWQQVTLQILLRLGVGLGALIAIVTILKISLVLG